MSAYIRLLRDNLDFSRLWLAQAISLFGDWFSWIALSTLVAKYSSEAGLAVGLLQLARFVPPLLVGPFAGVLVDRFNRKRLLIFSDVLRAMLVLMFLLVNSADLLWLVYFLTILQFCLSALFEPAQSAITPSLVKADDLVRANLLGSVTWSVMLAAGAALGGVVASLFGTATALCIDSASFMISAALISTIQWKPVQSRPIPKIGPLPSISSIAVPPAPVTSDQPTPISSDRSQLGFIDGLRYLARHPATGTALLIKLGGNIGNADTLMVIFATRFFAGNDNGNGSLGVLYSAFGLGAILGPLLLNRFNDGTVRRMRRLIVVGYALVACGWFLFGSAPTLVLVASAITVRAMGGSVYWTYSSVIIQKVTPDKFLGRLFSLDLAGFRLSTVLSILITSWLVDQAKTEGIRAIVIGTGVASIIPLVLWTLALPWIERQDAPAPIAVRPMSEQGEV